MVELTKRYIVMAMASEAPFEVNDLEGIFVLKPWKDPAALRALEVYRDNCYPELARDLDAWIAAIKSGPVSRGGVGTRNEPYIKTAAAPALATASRPGTKRPAARAPRRAARRSAPRSVAKSPMKSPVKSTAQSAAKKSAKRSVKKPAKTRR